MKHHLTAAVLLLGAFSAKAQYTRSLFYENAGSPIYQTSINPRANDMHVFSVAASTEDTLRIKYRSLNTFGDVIAEKSVQLVNPAIGIKTYLSGSFDEGSSVFTLALLSLQTNTTQQIGYVQLNIASGTITNTYFPTDLYKAGFTETRQSFNELATYLVSSTSGLQRVAKPLSGFASVSIENVDGAYTQGTPILNARKQSELLVIGGNEYLLATYTSGAMMYRRNGISNYTSSQLGSGMPLSRLVDLAVNTNGEVFAAVNDTCFSMDIASMIPLTTYSLSDANYTGSADGPSELFFHNGSYYRYRMSTGALNQVTRFDSAFGYVSTAELGAAQRMQHAEIVGTVVYLLGDSPNPAFNDHTDDTGQEINLQQVAFVSRTENWPALEQITEYSMPFVQDDLHTYLGQTGQLFPISPQNIAGARLMINDTLHSLVYSSRSYFAGKNDVDMLVGMNSGGFGSDLVPGPYTTSGSYSPLVEAKYNRGFYVTRQMIEDHVAAVASATPGYIPPHGIREWPAHGDPLLGQAENLAPFRDSDGDGIYEPLNGDYPLIYGDRCLLSIAHQGADHPQSSHIELQTYTFGFDCNNDPAYENTIFTKQCFIARGATLDSLYAGIFMDGDLGNYNDDYVGTNVELGLVYNYNGDLNDESQSGLIGYGENIPAQGYLLLKGSKLASDGSDNDLGVGTGETPNGYGFGDGISDNEYYTLESSVQYTSSAPSGMSDPTNLQENYNVLRGYYRFGDPQEMCGTSINTRFAYPGESDPLLYATSGINPGFPCSESTQPNSTGDRRISGATGATSLPEGDTLELVFAYVCAYDPTATGGGSIMDPVERLFDKCAAIKAGFSANNGPCGNDFGTIEENLAVNDPSKDPFLVYPNPTSGYFAIDGFADAAYTVSFFDINGRLLAAVEMNKVENTFSLEPYAGTVFLIHISDGTTSAVKRVVKR